MPGSSAGNACPGRAGGGSACISPGRRKVAGDTLWDAFMPLHPATNNATAGIPASRRTFQFSITEAQYRFNYGHRNTNFESETRNPSSPFSCVEVVELLPVSLLWPLLFVKLGKRPTSHRTGLRWSCPKAIRSQAERIQFQTG